VDILPIANSKPIAASRQVPLACAADPKNPLKILSVQRPKLDTIRTDGFPKKGTH
jgi:hypothetical protein